MRPALLALGLALVVGAGPLPQAGEEPLLPPVELRVSRGRARVLEGTEVVSWSAARGTRELHGPLTLEVGPQSEAEILWRGRMSLIVRGPASLALPDVQAQPLEPRVELEFAAACEIEVRRGRFRAGLRGGAELSVEGGAVGLVELPGGALEIAHRGGAPARYAAPGSAEPREIGHGSRVRVAVGGGS